MPFWGIFEQEHDDDHGAGLVREGGDAKGVDQHDEHGGGHEIPRGVAMFRPARAIWGVYEGRYMRKSQSIMAVK